MVDKIQLWRAANRLVEDDPGWNGTQNYMTIDGFDYEWLIEIAKAYLVDNPESEDSP